LSNIPVKATRCAFCTADVGDKVQTTIGTMTSTGAGAGTGTT
jgi:hypothetical protein